MAVALLVGGCTAPPATSASSSPTPWPTPSPAVVYATSEPAGWRKFEAPAATFSCWLPPDAESHQPEFGLPGTYQVEHTVKGSPAVRMRAGWLLLGPEDPVDRTMGWSDIEETSQKRFEQSGMKGFEVVGKVGGSQPGEVVVRLYRGNQRGFYAAYFTGPSPTPEEQTRRLAYLNSFHPELKRAPADDPHVAIKWRKYQAKDGSYSAMLPAEFSPGESEDGCKLLGRQFTVVVDRKSDLDFKTYRAGCKKDGPKAIDVPRRGAYDCLELVFGLPASNALSESQEYHQLVLMRPGRCYRVTVAGLKSDQTLAADARKVFDSFQPEQPKK